MEQPQSTLDCGEGPQSAGAPFRQSLLKQSQSGLFNQPTTHSTAALEHQPEEEFSTVGPTLSVKQTLASKHQAPSTFRAKSHCTKHQRMASTQQLKHLLSGNLHRKIVPQYMRIVEELKHRPTESSKARDVVRRKIVHFVEMHSGRVNSLMAKVSHRQVYLAHDLGQVSSSRWHRWILFCRSVLCLLVLVVTKF